MNNAGKMSDSHVQMIVAESQPEKRTRKKQQTSDKLTSYGLEVTISKVSNSEAATLDNTQTEPEVSRDSSSPLAIDYSVKRLSGRFVPFQKEQSNENDLEMSGGNDNSQSCLVNGNEQTSDKLPVMQLAQQYRPIKPLTQKTGGRSSHATAEPRVKRKYKRKEQASLTTPKVHKRRKSRADFQQPTSYYSAFNQTNDILRGLYPASTLPLSQTQQDVLQANRIFSVGSLAPEHRANIQSAFPTLPDGIVKCSGGQGGELKALASSTMDSPIWTDPQSAVEVAGKLKLNTGGIRLMPFLAQNGHSANLFQCGGGDNNQVNGNTPFQLLPIGPFQLINYQPNPQQLGSAHNKSQVGLSQQQSGIPMRMSRLTVIPTDLDTGRQHLVVEAQQTQVNAESTNFMEGPPGSPAFIIQDVVRRIHLNSTADPSTHQLSIKPSLEENRLVEEAEDSQSKQNEQSSIVLVERSESSAKRVSAESRRSSRASSILKTRAVKGDEFITHIVDGHIIKESLRPYKVAGGDEMCVVREGDCMRSNQRDGSNLLDNHSDTNSCKSLNNPSQTGPNACPIDRKSSRTENNSPMRKMEATRRKSSRQVGDSKVLTRADRVLLVFVKITQAKPILDISSNKATLICNKGNKRSRRSIPEMPGEALGPDWVDARKQPNNASTSSDDPSSSKLDNKDPSHWTVDDVCRFVADVLGHSPDLTDTFRSQEIDGAALLLVKEEFLMQFMNMKLGPALKLCNKINDLKSGKQHPQS